jgi:glycosyltransferase involved in cell wall biosynthesis
MRIGFDAKRAFNNKTGLGNYSRFVLEVLLKYHPEHQYRAYTPKNNRNLFSGFPEELAILPKSALDKKLSFYWRYATITKQLRDDKIDIFHGLSHEIPQGLQKANIRSVVTMHDLIFERLPGLFKPVDRLIYRHKFKSACSRADVIVAISEQTKRDLIEIYSIDPERIRVIYQDCNPLFKQHVDDKISRGIVQEYGIRSDYIVSVGTLEERKNQLRLVEAFAQLPANNFQLVLIGKATSYTAKIREFIKHADLEKRVLILENVPTHHLPALYQQAAVFAYISIYEGFGIPILEALHSGTPVLSAKGSCLEEAGGPGGLYADPLNVADIGEQMQKMITDQLLRNNLVSAGKEYIKRFTGAEIAGELVNLYSEIL